MISGSEVTHAHTHTQEDQVATVVQSVLSQAASQRQVQAGFLAEGRTDI